MEVQNEIQNMEEGFMKRLLIAFWVATTISVATKQNPKAFAMEAKFLEAFKQIGISAQRIQAFKDQLEKVRQSASDSFSEDIYVMGGVLIYNGILLPILMSIGNPDFFTRVAWITLAISLPCTVFFFLTRFLKERNGISSHGTIHSNLAFFAEVGTMVTTISLFFHVWNIAGLVVLFGTFLLFLGFSYYRSTIYFMPFLGIFKDILRSIPQASPTTLPLTEECE